MGRPMPTRLRSRVFEEPDEQDSLMQDSNALSMVSRVQERVEELRKMFELPQGEMFMDEFYCALHKRILLQGRMYVFENYVCFYSNLFGWVKQKAIPLMEVSEVSKKRNYGFPNSIQIAWKGKKEFFTSFLSRDDAFTLIANAWNQARLGRPNDILPGMVYGPFLISNYPLDEKTHFASVNQFQVETLKTNKKMFGPRELTINSFQENKSYLSLFSKHK